MANNRLKMLNELSANLPAMNQKAQAQRDAAIGVGVQGSIQQAVAAPAGQPAPSAGQIAAGAATAAGESAAQSTQQIQGQAAALGQEALRGRSVAFTNHMQQVNIQRTGKMSERAKHVDGLGRDLKAKLFDNNLKFASSEQGRKFSNERQLIDWTLQSSKNVNDFKDRMQKIQQVAQKKLQVLETAHQRLITAIKQGWLSKEQKLDQAQKEKLASIAAELQRKIDKERKKASNLMSAASGVMGVVGAVGVGYATGWNPTAMAAGYTAGSGAGQAIVGSGAVR